VPIDITALALFWPINLPHIAQQMTPLGLLESFTENRQYVL